jgi:hypothetical protein
MTKQRSNNSSSDESSGEKKTRQKSNRPRVKREYVKKIFLEIPNKLYEERLRDVKLEASPLAYLTLGCQSDIPVQLIEKEVYIKKDPEEIAKAKRLYRKEYAKQPHVIKKTKERLNDPEVIKKRQEYADREDVKEKKKALAKLNREIRNRLKEEKPDIYLKLREEALHANHEYESLLKNEPLQPQQ